jgi:hypothetical protein
MSDYRMPSPYRASIRGWSCQQQMSCARRSSELGALDQSNGAEWDNPQTNCTSPFLFALMSCGTRQSIGEYARGEFNSLRLGQYNLINFSHQNCMWCRSRSRY